MFSQINWATALWQARQLLKMVVDDAVRAGRSANAVLEFCRPQWDQRVYRPRYAPVYIQPTRRRRY